MTTYSVQDDTVRQIKDAAQIAEIIGECITLKKSGVNLKGLCPFHAEKTPSFMVSPERQTFHCFGCGEGGDVFTFMTKYYRMTFPEALKELAGRYHITLPQRPVNHDDRRKAQKREALFASNEQAAAIYHDFLLRDSGAAQARAYLQERQAPTESITAFRLGYAPSAWDFLSNKFTKAGISLTVAEEAGLLVKKKRGGYYDRFRDRILFPITDLSGRVVGFGGRILGDGQPKYLNSPQSPVFDKSRILFGLYQHRQNIRMKKKCVVVEGNFDLLSLAANGVDYVAAPLGTALSAAHVRTLKGYADKVILLFDGDAAGLKAAMRAVPIFFAEQVMAKVAVLPAEHDPDTFIRGQGKEELEKYLDNALPLADFVFDRLVDKYGLTMDGKGRILEELRPVIEADNVNALQRSVMISHFSAKLRLDPEQMLAGFTNSPRGTAISPPGYKPKAVANQNTVPNLPRKQKQLLEFMIIYPEYMQKFIDSGIDDVLVEPSAKIILGHLKKLCPMGPEERAGSPDQLLDLLPEGPERSFVSQLLISAQTLVADDNENMPSAVAAGMIAWLEKNRLILAREQLARKIDAAHHDGDENLLLELFGEKIKLDAALEQKRQG